MCFVGKGDPPKEITWWFEDEFGNERKLNTNDGIVITKTSSRTSILNIESVMRRHRGLYKCIVESFATSQKMQIQHSAYLAVNGWLLLFLKIFILLFPAHSDPSQLNFI